MSFFKRIASLFSGRSGSGARLLPIYAMSRRCKEPVSGTVDLYNELSGSDDDAYTFYCRKVLHTSGQNRCFSEVEFELWFDKNKNVEHYEVQGGRWLSVEEYEEELVLFNTPEDEDAAVDEPESMNISGKETQS